MNKTKDIKDKEWERLKGLFPELQPKADGRGRPVADTRAVLNGVLWILRNGSPWHEIELNNIKRRPQHLISYCQRQAKVG